MSTRRSLITLARRAVSSAKSIENSFPETTTYSQPISTSTSSGHSTALFLTALTGGSFVAYNFSASQPITIAHADAPAAKISAPSDPYKLPSTPHPLPKNIVLYQYEVCPFCCKVKAFLDYHKIPYRAVEVNPLTKAELKWSEYKKVPVILLDSTEQINDSSAIISRLAVDIAASNRRTGNNTKDAKDSSPSWWVSKSRSSSPKNKNSIASPYEEEEEKWRRWVDERLVRVITVNIYRSASESFQTFNYITEHGNFGWIQREAARVVGATMMWSLSNRLKKKYNVEGDVRVALYDCAEEWVNAVGTKKFLGGDSPNLADISVFGVMRSVVGTDTFMDLQHNTRIGGWYERMMGVVGESSRLPSV